MLYAGIDPGLSGGIATINHNGRVLRVVHMPDTCRGLLDELRIIANMAKESGDGVFVMLEDVHSTPQMGVTSAFTFGKGLGKILMGLTAANLPYDKVAPVRWQNVIGCRTPKERRAELGKKDKNINKARAIELFPGEEVTHAIADALMLAEYCRRDRGGRLFDDSAVEAPRRETRKTRRRNVRRS
jgi:hypothetical protein